MVTKDAWRVEAPALIKAELEKRLPAECKILRHEIDSFYYEGEEVRTVILFYTGAEPYADSQMFIEIHHDITLMFWELDFDPTPGFQLKREGEQPA